VKPLTLLQFSDLHLGAPGYAPSLGLPAEERRALREDLEAVLERLAGLAREREVDAVLVPGDLFDDESVDLDSVALAVGAFASLAPIPVLVAPGNHDPYRPDGYYGPVLLPARGRPAWPENVVLFRSEAWTTVPLPRREEISVTGSAYLRPVTLEERRLRERIPRPDSALSLLLLHGSRDGFAPRGKRLTLPFSEEELLAQGFTYTALGHYHEHSVVRDGEGLVRAAYAGCPQGRGLDETGARGALILTVTERGAEEVELVPTAERLVHRLAVEVGRLEGEEALLEALGAALDEAGVGARDLVVAELRGRVAPGAAPVLSPGALADRVGHVELRLFGLLPDYDLESYRSGQASPSTETRFARRLLEAIDAAEDPAERELLREALYIGLDALNGHRIGPR
jgi:DNA repair exonuclease SbcCD nuclease subunit